MRMEATGYGRRVWNRGPLRHMLGRFVLVLGHQLMVAFANVSYLIHAVIGTLLPFPLSRLITTPTYT
ncbi:hypothetical protein VNO80_08866 [Phaseolus coccineus]|uniref:Uncharacterized protein n=1 Tax=Phaseolus coccineus TaxID=3886 RepID=A0AAN9NAI9_PHACN